MKKFYFSCAFSTRTLILSPNPLVAQPRVGDELATTFFDQIPPALQYSRAWH